MLLVLYQIGQEAMKAARRAADMSGLMLTYLGQITGKQEALDLSKVCRQILPMIQASRPEGADLDVDLPLYALS